MKAIWFRELRNMMLNRKKFMSMLRMRITYSQKSMLLEVGSSGIPPSNNHGIWHSELLSMIKRQIRMLNYWEIEIYQLG